MKLRRVLVVDDDALTRRLVSRSLERAGIDVVEAASGLEALSVLEREAPDLVLLDWSMPDIAGPEVVRRARARESLDGVPFVLVSGHAERDDAKREALEIGAVALLSKPFSMGDLTAALGAAAARDARRVVVERARMELRHEMAPEIAARARALADLVERLAASRDDATASEIASFGHQLRGTAGSYGFESLAVAAREAEQMALRAVPDAESLRRVATSLRAASVEISTSMGPTS